MLISEGIEATPMHVRGMRTYARDTSKLSVKENGLELAALCIYDSVVVRQAIWTPYTAEMLLVLEQVLICE